MKRRILTIIIALAMVVMLTGCEFKVPFLNKPEDAVNEFLTQEKMMEILSLFEEGLSEETDDYSSKLWHGIFTSSSMKSLLLDNVRSISYTISDVKESDGTATVRVVITHLDLAPVAERAVEDLAEKLNKLDASGEELPEDDEEMREYVLPIVISCFKEAASKTKPSQTYSTVLFNCVKTLGNGWTIEEIPDDFWDKVLLMNYESAVGEALEREEYSN